MEKITSGLVFPLSLPLYSPYPLPPLTPKIIQTLISHTRSLSLSKTIRFIVLLPYRFLPLSLYLSLSLLAILRLPPLLSHKGFVFFVLISIGGGVSILVLFHLDYFTF